MFYWYLKNVSCFEFNTFEYMAVPLFFIFIYFQSSELCIFKILVILLQIFYVIIKETNLLDSQVLANRFYILLYKHRTHGDNHVILHRTDCIPDYNQIRSNRNHRLNDEWKTWYIRPWSIDTCSSEIQYKVDIFQSSSHMGHAFSFFNTTIIFD